MSLRAFFTLALVTTATAAVACGGEDASPDDEVSAEEAIRTGLTAGIFHEPHLPLRTWSCRPSSTMSPRSCRQRSHPLLYFAGRCETGL